MVQGAVILGIVGGSVDRFDRFSAVLKVEHCSGVLIARDAVLTSAHCLASSTAHAVYACERHPAYRPAEASHDIGLCKLRTPSDVDPIGLDERAGLSVGLPVTLVGLGQTGPLKRDAGERRWVTTAVTLKGSASTQVGMAQATGCLGDSGGPVLVERPDGWRVVAVIHGAAGAVCGSPVEVAEIRANREWLDSKLSDSRIYWQSGALGACAAIMLVAVWRRRRVRVAASAGAPPAGSARS